MSNAAHHRALCAASIISPEAVRSARNTADNCIRQEMCLAQPMCGDSVEPVVAGLPQGSGAPCPHRYPSPHGRRCDVNRTPPLFCAISTGWGGRRDPAHARLNALSPFDGGVILPFYSGAKYAQDNRGNSPCADLSEHNLKLYTPFCFSRHLPRAATHWASRPLSAVAPDWGRRPYWTATLPLARLSARRATSLIASPSRNAATNISRPLGAHNFHIGTIRAVRRGWSLSFSAPALRRGACI